MVHTHHALDYVELPAPDLAASTAFYAQAFGWSFNDYGDGAYAGIRSADGEGEVGGLNPAALSGTVGPLILLFSTDLDATVQAVEQAGGDVVQQPYAFPGGRRFHFRDPAGNELGVWSET
ncbi:VOC family protein [Actinotalea sp. BY-33]|uniref:VOC family protein n=1 Tax=Actinotalea soli TaxID=2819234 RepID=A0A939LP57_9CELL|nr:VOC family protein [Actinotalea soli]MBO1751243.1 VOC family protein [Actinotalea soli]